LAVEPREAAEKPRSGEIAAAFGERMKPGSWGSIWLVYIYSILCAASISKLLPIEPQIERQFHTTPAGVGFAISIISLSSVFAATIGGGIIDRIGARRAIIVTSIFLVFCNVLSFFATSMTMLDAARLLEGLEFIGIVVAAPALIMATTTGRRQVQAMTLWSTYTPAGVGLGLLLAVPFAGTSAWRWTFILHGALFALAAAFGWLLPDTSRGPAPQTARGKRPSWTDFLEIYREWGPWKLSISNALLVSIGLGSSTVIPRYFAHVHHVSIATSSSLLAAGYVPMIFAGIGAGYLLTRGIRPISVYIGITIAGVASGLLLYAPWISFPVAIIAIAVWLPCTGAAVAVLMALLPRVTCDPARGGAAMGLVGQVMAVGNFFTPPIYLGLLGKNNWLDFVALVLSGWILSLAFIPAWKHGEASSMVLQGDAELPISH
jgi:predicted MFS family arabinose efflux permease